jgi:hypothetical protein
MKLKYEIMNNINAFQYHGLIMATPAIQRRTGDMFRTALGLTVWLAAGALLPAGEVETVRLDVAARPGTLVPISRGHWSLFETASPT